MEGGREEENPCNLAPKRLKVMAKEDLEECVKDLGVKKKAGS